MYICRWSGGSVAFPVEGLEDALKSPHSSSKERAAVLLAKSFDLATKHAKRLQKDGHTPVILRAGRQSEVKGWRRRRDARTGTRTNDAGSLIVKEEVWTIPAGYVDTEADKHGPVIKVPTNVLSTPRTNAEKASWYENYHPKDKTCLWQ